MQLMSLSRILLSRPFRFVVGQEGVEIIVHEEAVASQSTALSTLVRGQMSESTAGVATWKDVDQETFIRFAQFAYTGDYSILSISALKKPIKKGEDEVLSTVQYEEDFLWGSPAVKKKKSTSRKGQLETSTQSSLQALNYPLLRPRSNFADTCDSPVMDGPKEDVSEALLSHVSLYILADQWGVESLMRLSLFKLHKSLVMLELDGSKVSCIVELVRAGYAGTVDRESPIDELRELICQYIAANVEVMSFEDEFKLMLEEGGDFVRDLWMRVLPRIKDD